MEENKERKQIKVSFGTVVSAIIITILVIGIVFLSILLYQTNLNFEEELATRDNEKEQMQTTITQLQATSVNSKEAETVKHEEIKQEEVSNLCHFNTQNGKVVSEGAKYSLDQFAFDGLDIIIENDNKAKFLISAGYEEQVKPFFEKITREIGTQEEITGFTKKVDEAKIGILGQEMHEGIITFLMEDGTVEYVTLKDAIENEKITTSGKIEGLENIVKIETATVGYGDGGNSTMIAIDKDGNFYDLLEMVET